MDPKPTHDLLINPGMDFTGETIVAYECTHCGAEYPSALACLACCQD